MLTVPSPVSEFMISNLGNPITRVRWYSTARNLTADAFRARTRELEKVGRVHKPIAINLITNDVNEEVTLLQLSENYNFDGMLQDRKFIRKYKCDEVFFEGHLKTRQIDEYSQVVAQKLREIRHHVPKRIRDEISAEDQKSFLDNDFDLLTELDVYDLKHYQDTLRCLQDFVDVGYEFNEDLDIWQFNASKRTPVRPDVIHGQNVKLSDRDYALWKLYNQSRSYNIIEHLQSFADQDFISSEVMDEMKRQLIEHAQPIV